MEKHINLYSSDNQMFRDAMDNLAVNIHFKKQQLGYVSVTLCGASPSIGTTTVAINLAISTALSGWKTILIDSDMRKNPDYKRLNDNADIGLGEYLSGKNGMESVIFDTNYELLQFIPCGASNINPVSLLCSPRFDELHQYLKENYDFAIFDASAINAAVDASVIASKTDTSIIVVGYGETEKNELNVAVKKLEAAGANVIGCTVNLIDKSEYIRQQKDCEYYWKSQYRKKARKKSNRREL